MLSYGFGIRRARLCREGVDLSGSGSIFSLRGAGRVVKCLMVSIRGIWAFYCDGFRRMTLGKVLWTVILVKLVVIFAVLRVFFFTPHLQGSAEEKGRAVSAELTERS